MPWNDKQMKFPEEKWKRIDSLEVIEAYLLSKNKVNLGHT